MTYTLTYKGSQNDKQIYKYIKNGTNDDIHAYTVIHKQPPWPPHTDLFVRFVYRDFLLVPFVCSDCSFNFPYKLINTCNTLLM